MRRLVFLLCAVCLVLGSPAHARIGNPIKKAKEKLQKAVEPQPASETQAGDLDDNVVFDNVTVELTNERVEGIIRSMEKAKASSAERSALAARIQQKSDEEAAVNDKEGRAMSKLRDKRAEVEACQHDAYQKARDRRTQEYTARALTDPALLAKFAKVAQENNAAAAQGDTTAIARANAAMMSEMLPTAQDSAEIRKACGTPPPKSAAELRLEALDKEMAQLNEELRKMDERVSKAMAKDVSMTDQQSSVALERVEMYMDATKSKDSGGGTGKRSKNGDKSEKGKGNGDKGKGDGGEGNEGESVIYPKVRGYTRAEIQVLEKHRSQLRAALE